MSKLSKEQMEKNKELEERLLEFAKQIIILAAKLPDTPANRVLRAQLIRAGTSIGANYLEACEAVSAKDFTYRIAVSRKEARETGYWLTLIAFVNSQLDGEIKSLKKECEEFVKIFNAIVEKFK